jgi:DNA polymerase III epsilon subunit-like protein
MNDALYPNTQKGQHPSSHARDDLAAYISVDIEASGPNPSQYSLLAIGACTLLQPPQTFYIELKPVHENAIAEALAIHGLSLQRLRETGVEPAEAMTQFAAWLERVVPHEHRPIFVSFNAPFDWMFVNDYFHRYLGYNPFGHTALDIKAFYMGLTGVSWHQTTMNALAPRYLEGQPLSHHALRDALDQATLFRKLLDELPLARSPASSRKRTKE